MTGVRLMTKEKCGEGSEPGSVSSAERLIEYVHCVVGFWWREAGFREADLPS